MQYWRGGGGDINLKYIHEIVEFLVVFVCFFPFLFSPCFTLQPKNKIKNVVFYNALNINLVDLHIKYLLPNCKE